MKVPNELKSKIFTLILIAIIEIAVSPNGSDLYIDNKIITNATINIYLG